MYQRAAVQYNPGLTSRDSKEVRSTQDPRGQHVPPAKVMANGDRIPYPWARIGAGAKTFSAPPLSVTDSAIAPSAIYIYIYLFIYLFMHSFI